MSQHNRQEAPRLTADQQFAQRIKATATKQLAELLGTEAGKRAAQAITMAFLGAVRTAKNPQALMDCSDASIATCVAMSAETQLYPGGPNPTVYLVPQAARKGEQPDLQWRISHRGLMILASRAGFMILPVPVGGSDRIRVSFGEVIEHESNPADYPTSAAALEGIIVCVRRLADGVTIGRFWCPAAVINARASKARDQSVWAEWPVEMAQKTAVKWAFSRGMVPLDSPELRAALEVERDELVIDATPARTTSRGALGLAPERPAIEDRGLDLQTEVMDEERERLAEREPIPAEEQKPEPKRRAQARPVDNAPL